MDKKQTDRQTDERIIMIMITNGQKVDRDIDKKE